MKKASIKKNYVFQVSYQILILIVPLITAPYLARTIGAESIGIQTLTFNLSNYFVIFSMLGLAKYGLRCIAEFKNDHEKCSNTFTELFLIHLIFSIIGIIVYSIYVFLFASEYSLLYWISIIYLIGSIFDVNWVFFGLEQFKLTVIRSAVVKIISTILIFTFVKSPNDLWIYILILSASQFISYIFLWPSLLKELKFTVVNIKIAFCKHFKNLLILFIPVISISLYKSIDKVMVGFIIGNEELGYYESADKIITIALAIISSLGTVLLPKLSSISIEKNYDEYVSIVEKSDFYNLFITFGCSAGLLAIASDLIPIFYGENFQPSTSILMILSITLVFSSLSDFVRMSFLIPQKMDKVFVVSVLIGVLIDVILNIPMIMSFGANGAAVSTIVAELSVCCYQYYMCRKMYISKKSFLNLFIFVLAAVLMYFIIHFVGPILPGNVLRLVLEIIIGFVSYVFISIILTFLVRRDIIHELIRRVKI